MTRLLLLLILVAPTVAAQTPPGNHLSLNGSSQYLSGTTPTGTRQLREVSSRMTAARIGFGTDQVLFDWTGVGILYVKAVSGGVTSLQFVPAVGTGTATVNISTFTTGFIYSIQYMDTGPNLAWVLQAWDARGDPKTVVSSIVTATATSIDPNNRAFRIGAKLDGSLPLQADIDFWRWHDQWIPYYPVAGQPGGQVPYPTFALNWQPCSNINGNENWVDYRFENDLNNSGTLVMPLTATGSPVFGANANIAPTAYGESLTGVAKGRIPLSATRSYDYDTSGVIPTSLSSTLSSSWTCTSAPGAGCGALTVRQPSRLFTWVDGATATGAYTFTFAVTDGVLTDSDTVTIQVAALSASIGDTACFVDEPCLIDASASTGWDSITVSTGETVPGTTATYSMSIPRSVHRYHSPGTYAATVTARDAQPIPASSTATATVTVTARPEANSANTEDLTNPANPNYISPSACTTDAATNTVKVQAALDIAKGRNTVPQKVIVPAGCRADGQLVAKVPVGTEMITLITSGVLPASHRRITVAEESQLFTIRATVTNEPALTTDPAGGSHHYKFRGLIFETARDQLAVVQLGRPDVEDTTAKISHHFIIQHCIVRPTDEFTLNLQNGILHNANDVSIIDSRVEKMSFNGIESHNVLSYSCEGRHLISNNYLGGASSNLFYGGAASTVRGMVPTDIEIEENYLWKPPEWKPSNPAWDHKTRGVKNLWELKTGSNIVNRGNRMENNWTDAQQGIGAFLQATCDSGNWASARNLDWSYNYMLNSEQGVEFRASEYRGIVQSEKSWFANNLLDRLTLRAYLFLQAAKVRMNHNTATTVSGQSGVMDGEMRDPGMMYENGIAFEGEFGWFGSGFSTGTVSFNAYFPGFIFRDSLQVGGSAGSYTPPVSGFQFPVDQAAVGFTDPAAGNWSLAPTSPYKGDANDGTDPGVDWNSLQAYLSHTVDGNWPATSSVVTIQGKVTLSGKVTSAP